MACETLNMQTSYADTAHEYSKMLCYILTNPESLSGAIIMNIQLSYGCLIINISLEMLILALLRWLINSWEIIMRTSGSYKQNSSELIIYWKKTNIEWNRQI